MTKQKKKSSNRKGVFIAVVSIILAMALVIASVITTGFLITGTANPVQWGNHRIDQPKAPDDGNQDKPGNDGNLTEKADMIITDDEENGVSLMSRLIGEEDYEKYGISPQAETAYTLTAAVYDENGSMNGMPQLVNAVADWENKTSFFAQNNDVSDFITLTRISDNSFNVSNHKAFDEPIIITVTAVDSDKSVTKRCHYIKRLKGINVYSQNGSIGVNTLTSVVSSTFYSGGTLQGNITFRDISFYFEDFMIKLAESSYYKYFAQKCEENGIALDLGNSVTKEFNQTLEDLGTIWFNLTDLLLSNMDNETLEQVENAVGLDYFRYAVIDTAKKVSSAISFDIFYTYSYNGIIYSDGMTEFGPPVKLNTSFLGEVPAIGSVTLPDNSDDIIF